MASVAKHVTVALALVAVALPLWAGLGNANTQPQTAKLDKVTFQLKGVTQAQFAGYYAAQTLGYYRQFGLDVTMKLGSQSMPISAWPLATTCSGVMLGPPTLMLTSSPNFL